MGQSLRGASAALALGAGLLLAAGAGLEEDAAFADALAEPAAGAGSEQPDDEAARTKTQRALRMPATLTDSCAGVQGGIDSRAE